jgi:hypothetical protein
LSKVEKRQWNNFIIMHSLVYSLLYFFILNSVKAKLELFFQGIKNFYVIKDLDDIAASPIAKVK